MQIRIKVHYCSVNPSDVEIVGGFHEYKPKLPFVPGYEMAGEVVEVGKDAKESGFKIGDKVIGLNKESCGGFAEECVVVSKVIFFNYTIISNERLPVKSFMLFA